MSKETAEELIELLEDCKYPIQHIHNGNHHETDLLARISATINSLTKYAQQSQVTDKPKTDGWISVEDEHPEHERGSTGFMKCLGLFNDSSIREVEYNMRTEKFQPIYHVSLEYYITHWQPLPNQSNK